MITNRPGIARAGARPTLALLCTATLLAAMAMPTGSALFAAEAGPTASGPVPLPSALERELALSALPAHLRAQATVYRLDPASGFVIEREGTNGFHAFVARNDPGIYQADWDHTRWDDLLIPIAFDAAGVDSHMQPYFDLARFRASGVSAIEAQKKLREGYGSRYQAPERAGISFMLAPVMRAYRGAFRTNEIATFSSPHYMYYAPDVTPSEVGSAPTLDHPVMLSLEPGPHGLIVWLKGRSESQDIRDEYQDLLAALCAHDQDLCLTR